jgi:hypothetical protein
MLASPDFVNQNEELSKRMLTNFMLDIEKIFSKYSFESINYNTALEKLDNEEFIASESFDPDEKPNHYANTTLKDVDKIIKECSGDNLKPLPLIYNISHSTLLLLDEDITNYLDAYEEFFPEELIERIVDIQMLLRKLLACLK